ncbi:nuclear transport factor 2 family protein [Streptomyces sp. NPDC005827]|uniref:nuclear transport factor 2 family protein n=1 Tax=Streptomyces sp. NPDC005827 TaxID=3157070 RepID=UPI0033D9C635
MTAPSLTSIDDAEAAWLKALLTPAAEPLRELLHPQFTAVHSPVGLIHDKEQFLTDTAKRPTPEDVRILTATIHEFPDMATVSCLQEMRIPFVPDTPAFPIQQAVTRVWIRVGDRWQLAQLQLARRLPPA